MGNPMFGLVTDLALAEGSEVEEATAMRRRVAIILWGLLLAPLAYLGGWTNSGFVFGGAFILVVAGLWIYAEYGDRIAAPLRGSSD
jgi:hypothetical protein